MPRSQIDIVKDLIIAHLAKDDAKFLEDTKKYIGSLEYRGFFQKAEEIKRVLNLQHTSQIKSEEFIPTLFVEQQPIIKEDVIHVDSVKTHTKEFVWQLAYSSEIDFILINKVMNYVNTEGKLSFTFNELTSYLGYGKDKGRGIIEIMQYMGILLRQNRKLSEFGKLLLKNDPYFENIGALWLLHYYIGSQPRIVIWNRLIQKIFCKNEFVFNDLLNLLEDLRLLYSKETFLRARREFGLYIKAYLNSPLSKLKIIKQLGPGQYGKDKQSSIPDLVFLAALLLFKERFYPRDVAIEVKYICFNENSPGKLFYLNETTVRQILERLRGRGYILLESFADLDQVKFITKKSWIEIFKDNFLGD